MKKLFFVSLFSSLIIQCKDNLNEDSCCYSTDYQLKETGISQKECLLWNDEKKSGKNWEFSVGGCPLAGPPDGG